MAKETITKTYRLSHEVIAALARLAKLHGGVDRALRAALGIESKAPPRTKRKK